MALLVFVALVGAGLTLGAIHAPALASFTSQQNAATQPDEGGK